MIPPPHHTIHGQSSLQSITLPTGYHLTCSVPLPECGGGTHKHICVFVSWQDNCRLLPLSPPLRIRCPPSLSDYALSTACPTPCVKYTPQALIDHPTSPHPSIPVPPRCWVESCTLVECVYGVYVSSSQPLAGQMGGGSGGGRGEGKWREVINLTIYSASLNIHIVPLHPLKLLKPLKFPVGRAGRVTHPLNGESMKSCLSSPCRSLL